MEVRALASDQPVSPRKVRLVLKMIRGMSVERALATLAVMPQRSAGIVATAVKSAAANAENNYELNPDGLIIKSATAGDARSLKRFRARSRGRTSPLVKRRSHIEIIVEGDEGF